MQNKDLEEQQKYYYLSCFFMNLKIVKYVLFINNVITKRIFTYTVNVQMSLIYINNKKNAEKYILKCCCFLSVKHYILTCFYLTVNTHHKCITLRTQKHCNTLQISMHIYNKYILRHTHTDTHTHTHIYCNRKGGIST